VCRAADLGRNRLACRPARGVIPLVIPRSAQSLRDQSHSASAHLGGKLVRRFARHGSILLGSWSLRQTGGGSKAAPPLSTSGVNFVRPDRCRGRGLFETVLICLTAPPDSIHR
jgi:hypothetical protein